MSIAQYKELLSRASLMEWKLKAMENLQDLLRQKDQELRKCWNMIQQYQMALRKAENLRIDSVHKIAKISEARDRYGRGRGAYSFLGYLFLSAKLVCILTY